MKSSLMKLNPVSTFSGEGQHELFTGACPRKVRGTIGNLALPKRSAVCSRHNVINLSNLKVRGLSFKVGKPKAQSYN
jgi:hypothetical protein